MVWTWTRSGWCGTGHRMVWTESGWCGTEFYKRWWNMWDLVCQFDLDQRWIIFLWLMMKELKLESTFGLLSRVVFLSLSENYVQGKEKSSWINFNRTDCSDQGGETSTYYFCFLFLKLSMYIKYLLTSSFRNFHVYFHSHEEILVIHPKNLVINQNNLQSLNYYHFIIIITGWGYISGVENCFPLSHYFS